MKGNKEAMSIVIAAWKTFISLPPLSFWAFWEKETQSTVASSRKSHSLDELRFHRIAR